MTWEPRSRQVLFTLLVLVVIAVPVWWIVAHEQALSRGEIYRFRTEPVDPYDAFRGRYVALSFPDDEAVVTANTRLEPGQRVFVTVERDADGFARLGRVSTQKPEVPGYLRLSFRRRVGNKARFDLPFDRYYMNEHLAPEAERIYQRSAREAWVSVRIYRGRSVIEELYVEGRPIAELVGGG